MVEKSEEKREWQRRGWFPDNREKERRRIEIELMISRRSDENRRQVERRSEIRRKCDREALKKKSS